MRTQIIMLISLLFAARLYAGEPVITLTDGYACLGDGLSREQTELLAKEDALRRAPEHAAKFSEAAVHDLQPAENQAHDSNPNVNVLQELDRVWYKEAGGHDCVWIKLKVEMKYGEASAGVAENVATEPLKAVTGNAENENLSRGGDQKAQKLATVNETALHPAAKSATPPKVTPVVKPKKNGWVNDGETAAQKRIVTSARAEAGKASGQSSVGSGHLTDIAGGDGAKMRAAINIHHEWKKKPGTKTLEEIKKEMRAAFKNSAYETAQINALVDRIIEVYNPKTIPASDSAVLGYLGIRRQCHEWADYIGGKGDTKPLKDIKDVRPGMGYFIPKPNEHAMIITGVLWKDDVPVSFKVAEANWASGWANPKGAVPWKRTVQNSRTVDVKIGRVGSYE